jgi:hypothetical protein
MNPQDEQEYFDRITLELMGYNPDCLVPMKDRDDNWLKLRQEQSLPKSTQRTAIKLANCRVKHWHDTSRLSAEYDVGYDNNSTQLNKQINGEFSTEEPFTPTAVRVFDALTTLVARSHGELTKCRSSRFYLPNDVKTVVRDFYFMQTQGNYYKASWIVFNNNVYPTRLDETNPDCDTWIFNHRRKIVLEDFLNQCWEAV